MDIHCSFVHYVVNIIFYIGLKHHHFVTDLHGEYASMYTDKVIYWLCLRSSRAKCLFHISVMILSHLLCNDFSFTESLLSADCCCNTFLLTI